MKTPPCALTALFWYHPLPPLPFPLSFRLHSAARRPASAKGGLLLGDPSLRPVLLQSPFSSFASALSCSLRLCPTPVQSRCLFCRSKLAVYPCLEGQAKCAGG